VPRLVFAADSHLNKRYARMSPDQLGIRRGYLRSALQQTLDYAISADADLYVHGGDLFDSPNPRSSELTWTAEQLQRLRDAGVHVLLIGGNHDVPKTRHHGAAPQALFEAVRLAHVFDDAGGVEWRTFDLGGTRLAVGGLPPDHRLGADDEPLDALADLAVIPEADLTLLVTHYAVEGLLPPSPSEATIRREALGKLSGRVDIVLAGHLHEGHDFDVGGVRVVFPGPTERLTFGELDARPGFVVLDIEGRRPCRVGVKHVRVEPQPMVRESVAAASLPPADPTGHLLSLVQRMSRSDQITQLRLHGRLRRETYQALRFLDVWQLGNDLNFYFDLDRHGLTVEAPEAATVGAAHERISPRSEIARVAESMSAAAGDGAERAVIEEAKDLALERYGAGAIGE